MNDSELTVRPISPMVPAEYAEKAMGSLMQLHSELMEEKERRVDLYRRLMEKEQSVAELKMYVKLLEERLGVSGKGEPAQPAESAAARPAPRPPPPPSRPLTLVRPPAPRPPQASRSVAPPARAPAPDPVSAPPPRARTGTGTRGFAAEGWKAW